MKYSKGQLEEIAGRLRELPPVEDAKTHNKQDAVRQLSAEIAELRARGYSLERVAEALSAIGLSISTTTLKNYLHRTRSTGGKSPGKKRSPNGEAGRKQRGSSGVSGQVSSGDNSEKRAGSSSGSNGVSKAVSGSVNTAATFVAAPDSEDI